MPVPLQLDRRPLRQQLKETKSDRFDIAMRRWWFWLARHRWPVTTALVLLWLGRLLWAWYQRGGMPTL